MFKRLWSRIFLAGLPVLVAVTLGCDGQAPSAPTGPPTGPPPAGPAPIYVSRISPATGPVIGGTPVTISGRGFQPGATVTIAGSATHVTVVTDLTLTAFTPPHDAGVVDVVVRNPDGNSATLAKGYTFSAFPQGPAPSVTALTPAVGSTMGGTPVRVIGTGFVAGTTVILDGTPMRVGVHEGTIYLMTPRHAAGAVDVVVTTPDGQTARLIGGYTYVPPAALDVNGDWEGNCGPHWDFKFRFTVRDNLLVSVSSDNRELTFSQPSSTRQDRFSAVENGVIVMAGEFLSGSYGVGSIDLEPCANTNWEAWKK